MSAQDGTTRHRATTIDARTAALLTLAVAAALGLGAAQAQAGRSRLSDAVREAAKPPAQQRPLSTQEKAPVLVVVPSVAISIAPPCPLPLPDLYPVVYPDPYPEPRLIPEAAIEPNDGDPWPAERRRFNRLHVGTVVAMGSLSSPEFAPHTRYGVRIGTGDSRRTTMDLALLGGPLRFAPGSDIANALDAPREVGLEGSIRYALTQPRAGLGIAPVAGFGMARLSWRYHNEIQIETDGVVRTVSSDNLWHYSSHLGVALTFLHSRHVDLGVMALHGWRFYRGESGEGLTNDLFPTHDFNELRLETRVVL